jgi:hypothetical protein
MIRVGISVVLLAIIAAPVVAEPAPIKATVRQLLTAPKKYNGRRVDVVGFYRGRYEDSSLCTTAHAAADPQEDEKTAWVEASIYDKRYGNPPASPKSPEYNFTGRVHVIGTFRYHPAFRRTVETRGDGHKIIHQLPVGYGHMGLWSCALFDVTYFRVLK